MAVRAAMGFMDSIMEEIVKNDVKAKIESKITAVPTAKFLWLILVPTYSWGCFDLMLSSGTLCSGIRQQANT